MALTAANLNAADALFCGLADVCVPHDHKANVLDAIASATWAGEADADMYVVWTGLLEALIECARHGPADMSLERVGTAVARAVRQNEPQWAVPWLSYAALAQAWAGRDDDLRLSIEAMLSAAATFSCLPSRNCSYLRT